MTNSPRDLFATSGKLLYSGTAPDQAAVHRIGCNRMPEALAIEVYDDGTVIFVTRGKLEASEFNGLTVEQKIEALVVKCKSLGYAEPYDRLSNGCQNLPEAPSHSTQVDGSTPRK